MGIEYCELCPAGGDKSKISGQRQGMKKLSRQRCYKCALRRQIIINALKTWIETLLLNEADYKATLEQIAALVNVKKSLSTRQCFNEMAACTADDVELVLEELKRFDAFKLKTVANIGGKNFSFPNKTQTVFFLADAEHLMENNPKELVAQIIVTRVRMGEFRRAAQKRCAKNNAAALERKANEAWLDGRTKKEWLESAVELVKDMTFTSQMNEDSSCAIM